MAEALPSGRLPAPNAAVARRRVATALRRLRAASGESQDQVAAATNIGRTKLGRIEDQSAAARWTDVAALLMHYGVDETNREPWIKLAQQAWRSALQRGDPWADYRSDLPRQHLRTYELTDAAAGIDSFNPRSIPPLLQTQSLALALAKRTAADHVRRTKEGATPELAALLVALTAQRQQMLQREDPPKLNVVLLGLDMLMPGINDRAKGKQLAHLIELAQRPNITIRLLLPSQTLAKSQGLTEQELSSDIGIVRFADPADPPGSYRENQLSADPFGRTLARFEDDPEIVAALQDRFERIAAAALEPDESLERLLVAHELLAPSGKAAPARPRRKPDAAGRRGVGPPGTPRKPLGRGGPGPSAV